MATKETIKATILSIAGNPESGVVKDYADKWAEAIASLDTATPFDPTAKDGDGDGKLQDGTPHERLAPEKRVTKSEEIR